MYDGETIQESVVDGPHFCLSLPRMHTSQPIHFLAIFLVLPFLGACQSTILPKEVESAEHIVADQNQSPEFPQEHAELAKDLRRLQAHSRSLVEMAEEMFALQAASQLTKTGYFEPREHDRIENLLFRYLISRRSLWEMVERHVQYREKFQGQMAQTKSAMLALSAGVHLSFYSSLVVEALLDYPAAQEKLNEAYPRSGIEAGTYSLLFQQVTRTDHIRTLQVAWELFSRELQSPDTPLYRLAKEEGPYAKLIADMVGMYEQSVVRVTGILARSSLLLPELRNQIRHSSVSQAADEASRSVRGNLYAMQTVLFTLAGDTQATPAIKLYFSAEQKKKVRELLRPGDIILSFSGGYMSNIFLPGKFKHAIVYVGDVKAREKANIKPEDVGLSSWEGSEKLPNGQPIEIIEAVSEGVVYNSLEHVFDGYMTRFVALRPTISPEKRIEGLRDVFSYVGSEYDFNFDFSNGTRQCCTEIVYRMLQKRDDFDFKLVKRAGVFTLSADDILEHHMRASKGRFSYVLAAIPPQPDTTETAALLAAPDDETRFMEILSTW